MNRLCNIHDYYTAQCPKCMHREYTFLATRNDLSPEVLDGANLEVRCCMCGTHCITVPRVVPLCQCSRCIHRRANMEAMGMMLKEGYECNREGSRCH